MLFNQAFLIIQTNKFIFVRILINIALMDNFQQFKIGLATFKQNITEIQKQQLNQIQDLRTILSSSLWSLEHGVYEKINGTAVFNLMEEAEVQRLWLFRNRRPTILLQIVDVDFRFLTKLMISKNLKTQITTILLQSKFCKKQICLCYNLYAQVIKKFIKVGSHICNIRSLRKCNLPMIDFIGVEKNFINDYQSLSQLNAPLLSHLLLQRDEKDSAKGEAIQWMSKLQTKNLQYLWIKSKHRLKNVKVLQKLQQKFNQLTIQA